MSMPKNELIEKLEEISALYANTKAIQARMDAYTPEDHYDRKIVVPQFPGEYRTDEERDVWQESVDHREDDAVAQMEAQYKRIYAPRKPSAPRIEDFKKPTTSYNDDEKVKNYGCLATAGAVLGGMFALSFIANLVSGIPFISVFPLVVAAIGALLFVFGRSKKKQIEDALLIRQEEAYAAYNKEKTALLEAHKVEMQAYEEAMKVCEENLRQFISDYSQWREIYLKSVQEETVIAQKLEEDRQAGVQKIYEQEYLPAEAALKEGNNLVAVGYLPALSIIVSLLKSGRADDLKEAINLYEVIVYRERQLALEREKEAQRQYEEQQRRRDEERRYQADMQFRKDQERQRQREEEQRQKDAERHHREEMQQRERQAQEEKMRAARERESQKRCEWCAHKLTCRQRYYDGAYNCTGFTPQK